MSDFYKCEDCQSRYQVPVGAVIRCPFCSSKMRGKLSMTVDSNGDTVPAEGVIAALRTELASVKAERDELRRRAPDTDSRPTGGDDWDDVCSVCSAVITEPHTAKQCFEMGKEVGGIDPTIECDQLTEALAAARAERDEAEDVLREMLYGTSQAHESNERAAALLNRRDAARAGEGEG